MIPKYIEVPEDKAAEGAVIGSILLEPDCFGRIVEYLNDTDFVSEEAGFLFNAIKGLWQAQQPIDAVVLRNSFADKPKAKTYLAYMLAALDTLPSSANALFYAKLVRQKATERKLITLVEKLNRDVLAPGGDINDKLTAIQQAGIAAKDCEITQYQTDLNSLVERYIFELVEDKGIPTSFPNLDRLIGGFKPKEFILVAGRPSMGKSSLLLDFYIHAARLGARPYLYSLEMGENKIINRMLRNIARWEKKEFDKASTEILEAVRLVKSWPGWIEQKVDYNIDNLCTSILAQKQKNNIGIAFVDYLQLIEASGHSRYEQITKISRSLKKLADTAKIPIIAAAQLNRAPEQRSEHRPLMSDLRDSGSIEQDADIILFLHRDDYYRRPEDIKDSVGECIVAKNREGETGVVKMLWLPECTSFRELSILR